MDPYVRPVQPLATAQIDGSGRIRGSPTASVFAVRVEWCPQFAKPKGTPVV